MADGVDRQMHQGQDRWIGLQVLIPANYPTATWNAIVQLKGEGTGNGPIGIYFENGKLALKKSTTQAYGSTTAFKVWDSSTATARDVWVKLLVHVKWSTGGDGAYELLGDLADGQGFRQLKALTTGWTLKYGSSGAPVNVWPPGSESTAPHSRRTRPRLLDGFNVSSTRTDATLRAFGNAL